MTRLELSIAWRYLRSRRGSRLLSLISAIAIGGVVVGVSALIVIIGVMDGLQSDLRDKLLIGSPDIQVLTYGEDLTMPHWATALAKVRRLPGVVAVSPFITTQAGINAGHKYAEAVMVMGIVPEGGGMTPVTGIRSTAIAGDFTFVGGDGARKGIVLGNRLAARLGVVPDRDSVQLISLGTSRIDPLTGFPAPRYEKYEVTGIFRTGMYQYDNAFAFLALDAAQELSDMGTSVTGLEVRTRTRDMAPAVARMIGDSLRYPYRTEDWQAQNASLFHALELEKFGMSFILLLIVLVAAFNIVSTLTMVVSDKTKEIGILRAMGMPGKSIGRIFFAQGLVIGVVGTAAGVVLGLVASVALNRYRLIPLDPTIYFIDHLPAAIQRTDVALIVVASLVIAALATIYPARQAARLYPVEAIRHE